jgi:hypothetical protein
MRNGTAERFARAFERTRCAAVMNAWLRRKDAEREQRRDEADDEEQPERNREQTESGVFEHMKDQKSDSVSG